MNRSIEQATKSALRGTPRRQKGLRASRKHKLLLGTLLSGILVLVARQISPEFAAAVAPLVDPAVQLFLAVI